jgi:hypothetical protein
MACLPATEDFMDAEVTELNCTICGKPLDLRTAHTDGYGKPIHSECYASRALPPDDSQQHPE